MPITTRKPAPATILQKFRAITEGYLLQVAQGEMVRKYPNTGTKPASKEGFIYNYYQFYYYRDFV